MSQFIEMFGFNDEYPKGTEILSMEEVVSKLFAGGDKPTDYSDSANETYKYPIIANGVGETGVIGYSKESRVDEDALTISARGTIGYCAIRKAGFLPVVRLITLVPNHKVLLLYLKFYFEHVGFESTGAVQGQLTMPSLKEKIIVVPPLKIQKQFCSLAEQADKSEFDGFKSQFIEMFKGDYQTEKWEDCLSITNGKKYDGDYQEYGSFPICGSGGIMGYGESKFCDKDTVILGRKGNINSPIYMKNDYWIVDTAFSLAVDRQKLQPKYFYFWCKRFDFTKYNKQGVLPSLTKNDLQKIEIPIPPMELQTSFVVMLEQADKSENRSELKQAS